MLDENEVVEKLKTVDKDDIPMLFSVIQERYRELYPDWDIVSFSLEKSKDRNKQIDKIIKQMKKYKDHK